MCKLYLISILIFCINFTTVSSRLTNNTVDKLLEIIVPYLKISRLQVLTGPKCFSDLGCFKNDGPFRHPIYRPLSLSPEDPEVIATKFHLYSSGQQETPQWITTVNLTRSSFDPFKRTVIAVHGFYFNNFFGAYQKESFQKLRATLTQEKINYIFVDWGKGSTTFYTQATANTRVVGAEIASLISKIVSVYNYSTEKIWLIGHSLGAHVVGYAGSIVKNIGRITGLDPAKPYFVRMPDIARLDANDAQFVDVIHTNAPRFSHPFGFGTRQILGNIDFYPNGGNAQPGCYNEQIGALFQSLEKGIQVNGVCNHQRSILMFSEAINVNQKCQMIGYSCPSFSDFKLGRCYLCGEDGQKCAIMGKNEVNKTHGQRYYLLTSQKPPFCVFHYRVEIIFKTQPSYLNFIRFNLTLISNNGSINSTASGHSSENFISNGSSAFLLIGERPIHSDNLKVHIGMKSDFNGSLYVKKLSILPLYFLEDSLKIKNEKTIFNVEIFTNRINILKF